MGMAIDRLDHLVLTVKDIAATCAFYEKVLGMRVATFGQGRTALHFGRQKINLHQTGREFNPKARVPTEGSGDLCFIAAVPMPDVLAHLKAQQVPVVEGPGTRTGALGPMESVYVRDPDGNLVEISCYPRSA